MAEIELTQPSAEDFAEFITVPLHSYGSDATPDRIAFEVLSNEIDRSWGVRDQGRWVAASGAFSLAVTLPGPTKTPAAGVTMIGVAPTHRRRGILTSMLRRLHDDARDRGEPLALLTASETSIYRRFGYGIAFDVAHVEIAADAMRFDPPLADTGSFTLVDPRSEVEAVTAAHDALWDTRAGLVKMTPGMWTQVASDPDFARDDRSTLHAAIHHDAQGNPDGYCLWRIEASARSDRLAANTAWIEVLIGANPQVEAALWAFISGVDLVTTLAWENAPVQPTIRWRLIEPRQLRTLAVTDMVWARILDVPRVLSARTYDAAGTLTMDVTDRFHPESGGRFRLCVAQAGNTGVCESSTDDTSTPDLTLDTADLASIVVGGVPPSHLAACGRVIGSPDAVSLADLLFRVAQRPWWPIEF